MRYGFYLPTRGGCATPEALEAIVERGEALGFHSVMIADHVVFPTDIKSKYPYTVSGEFPGGGDALEQLALMSFVAARTRRLRLVTSVMILPYRHPVLTAKMLATIDVLSRGRVTVGVGVGWLREEFEALDAPDFERRGAVSDEISEDLQDAVDPESRELRRASSTASRRSAACPGRCRRRIRPSGSAAIARRRCGGRRATATAGIRWAPIRPCRCGRPSCGRRWTSCYRMTEAEKRDPSALTISFKAPVYDVVGHRRWAAPSAGRSRGRRSRWRTTSAPTRSSA